MQGRGESALTLSRGARITVTVLLLVLPVSCVLLALTAPAGLAAGWWWLAALNAVLPAVILPFVWRSAPEPPAQSDDVAGPATGVDEDLRDLAAR
jgi:uncharacterized membrane protein